jgi:hypothetical protein
MNLQLPPTKIAKTLARLFLVRLTLAMFLKVGLWVRGFCENFLCVCVAYPKCCVKMQCQLAPIHWATYPVVGAGCPF